MEQSPSWEANQFLLNGTHQLLVYADINIFGGSINIIRTNREVLVVVSKGNGLEVNAYNTKYMVMSRYENAGRSYSMKTDNSSFERVEEYRYLWTTLTNQNSIQEEIKNRLNSVNAWYHLVQNLSSFGLLFKNEKIEIYRIIISSVVLYGCESWSLKLREERSLMLSENRVLRRIFGSKRDEVTKEWRKLQIEELNNLYSSPSIFRVIKSRRMRWAGHVARMGESRVVYRVLVGKPEGKNHLEEPGVDGRILRWIFRKWHVGAWTGSSWLRIGTGGGHLWMR